MVGLISTKLQTCNNIAYIRTRKVNPQQTFLIYQSQIQITSYLLTYHTKKMLHSFSPQFIHHSSYLLQTLATYHKQTGISDIYLTQHCNNVILSNRLTETELFGCGFKKIYNKKTISPYQNFQKIIVVAIVGKQCFAEIDEVEYLFPEIFLLTLQTTLERDAIVLRQSKARKLIKMVREINMNFMVYLDNAYFVAQLPPSSLFEQKQQALKLYTRPSLPTRLSAYRSFLQSYPKIYEYELHYVKSPATTHAYTTLVEQLTQNLTSSLSIMQSHESEDKTFDRTSSPKIKCLILNRQLTGDFISPLLYGYYYGALCEECVDRGKILEGGDKFGAKGKMFNALFQKDFNQAAAYVQAITNDKTALDGEFQTNYFYKAKHLIVSYEDPSPIEIALHISLWKTAKAFGVNKLAAGILQQDLANRMDEQGRELSNGKCVDKVKKWVMDGSEEEMKFITEDELMKLSMILQMTGDLWFFNNNAIKKLFDTEKSKLKYENFLKKRQSLSTHKLTEKHQPQDDDRSQLYRHQPRLLSICEQWLRQALGLQNSQNGTTETKFTFDKTCINNDIMRNRDSRLVIIIDGLVGYNQLAMMRRMIKTLTDRQVTIVAEAYCNSQQYVDFISEQVMNGGVGMQKEKGK